MSQKETREKIGEVQVADEVVAAVAGFAALETDGVAQLASKFSDNFTMRNLYKGVHIDMQGVNVQVSLAIIVKYGYSIPKVSSQVQEKVVSSIQNMIGLHVTKVDIRVAGVEPNTATANS